MTQLLSHSVTFSLSDLLTFSLIDSVTFSLSDSVTFSLNDSVTVSLSVPVLGPVFGSAECRGQGQVTAAGAHPQLALRTPAI